MNRRGFFGSLLGAVGLGALMPKALPSLSSPNICVAYGSGFKATPPLSNPNIYQHYGCMLRIDVDENGMQTVSGQVFVKSYEYPPRPYDGYKRVREHWTQSYNLKMWHVVFRDQEVLRQVGYGPKV